MTVTKGGFHQQWPGSLVPAVPRGKDHGNHILMLFPAGLGVGEMLTQPQSPARRLQADNPVSFLTTRAIVAAGDGALGASMELLGQMLSGQGGDIALCSWISPEQVTCPLTGCWQLGHVGHRSRCALGGVTLFPMWSPHVQRAAPLPPALAGC